MIWIIVILCTAAIAANHTSDAAQYPDKVVNTIVCKVISALFNRRVEDDMQNITFGRPRTFSHQTASQSHLSRARSFSKDVPIWNEPGAALWTASRDQSRTDRSAFAAYLPFRRGGVLMHAMNDESGGALDFGNVLNSLKSDVPNILRMEPNWANFAEDFKVIDHTGARLEGLESCKQLVKLLRSVREQFVVKYNITIDPIIRSLDVDPFLVAQWQIQLGGAELEDIVDIEAVSVFRLNPQNQIEFMRIEEILFNGYDFNFWPKAKLSDDTLTNLRKVKTWAQEILELKKIKDPSAAEAFDFQELETDAASEDNNTLILGSFERGLVLALRNIREFGGKWGGEVLGFGIAAWLLTGLVSALSPPTMPIPEQNQGFMITFQTQTMQRSTRGEERILRQFMDGSDRLDRRIDQELFIVPQVQDERFWLRFRDSPRDFPGTMSILEQLLDPDQ